NQSGGYRVAWTWPGGGAECALDLCVCHLVGTRRHGASPILPGPAGRFLGRWSEAHGRLQLWISIRIDSGLLVAHSPARHARTSFSQQHQPAPHLLTLLAARSGTGLAP